MNLRRTLALGATVTALTVPLSACGFNYATDRVYTPAAGVNYRGGPVDVLNAALVSNAANSGTFVASLVNTDQTAPVKLTGLASATSGFGNVSVTPVDVPPNSLVNLATQGSVPVSGSFKAGDFVSVDLTFSNGQQTTMDIPVVADAGQWAGLDTSTASATPAGSPSASASPTATTSATASASATATGSSSASASASN